MKAIETEIEGLRSVKTDVGWWLRSRNAAEVNVRQAYTIKHIRKGLPILKTIFIFVEAQE